MVDLIPCHFSQIPQLFRDGQVSIDIAFIQLTKPDESGYCSLGPSVDVAREAMEKAHFVVGEINEETPHTYGDTFVHISEFDAIIQSNEKPIYFQRWPEDKVFDKVAANVASTIEDGNCISFSIGPLFESLSKYLMDKKDLGIHSPIFTDSLMDLIKSGAVTNRHKRTFPGKSLTTYALGTPELYKWLDRNPLVEFQSISNVFNPMDIAKNSRFVAIIHTRKVDLSGHIALHVGQGNVATGPAEIAEIFNGAKLSKGGLTIFALASRNLKGEPNILISVDNYPNQFSVRESVDLVITEYGVASLKGKTVRERAQVLIDIAHPDDREKLLEKAKEKNMVYSNQIFLPDSAHLYPEAIATSQVFKYNTKIRFRAIRPSDDEEMRHLFYRFSDEAVYYRYFTPIKTMPHSKMQKYVNINYKKTMSIVALSGRPEHGHVVAEARFVRSDTTNYADIAFVVDEQFQNIGIASYLYKMLIRIARDMGIEGFTADVLSSNKEMMHVFEKCKEVKVNINMSQSVNELEINFL
jgi:acyl-CoA hydrolase/ribosomal protein S18 acetylase RimI-like enzyme